VFASLLGLALLCLPRPVAAGWAVAPIRVDFSPQLRTETVSVTNDGDAPLHFDVAAMTWTQDAAGQDTYTETSDLVFFPKYLAVPPKETRVIRVGIKAPAVGTEKCYRLFIREKPRTDTAAGTRVAILVNFGVPIFSRPAVVAPGSEITSFAMQQGQLAIGVRNSGNVHLQLQQLTVTGTAAGGEEIFRHDLKGWYLLAGRARTHAVEIPPEVCPQLRRVTVTIAGDGVALERSVEAEAAACSR
jgi:fimbrial chaperone protein